MSVSSDVERYTARLVDPGRVAKVMATMPAEAVVTDVADVFDLLSDTGRLRLIVALLGGELCVSDLAAAVGLSESATSHALRILRAHRVVKARRSGRMAFYALADSHVRRLLELALAHAAHTSLVHEAHDMARGGHG
ncbi:MAG TPA: metalloregulator ArsR/SmtB family transcription factor [Acidimicrobiales bacterium]|nr:metalloregulator ArsR/SmtB family transcription factor [Acidimicrobiales bacterium]